MVYRKGQHNVIDDFTGFKRKSGDLKKNVYGFMCDSSNLEPRHPQETLRVRGDKQSVTNVRKETVIFLGVNEVKAEDL